MGNVELKMKLAYYETITKNNKISYCIAYALYGWCDGVIKFYYSQLDGTSCIIQILNCIIQVSWRF